MRLFTFSTDALPLLFSCTLLIVPTLSVENDDARYTAAAVQYTDLGSTSSTPQENLRRNLESFESHSAEAAAKGAQIIVFPEAVLWSIAFSSVNPRENIKSYGETLPGSDSRLLGLNPCEEVGGGFEATPILRNASCMAKSNGIAVVYNTVDIQSCDVAVDAHCPSDGEYHFNSDVALDTDGTLLAVYHKVHIFGTAPALDEPEKSDVVSFTTSFGVTFGLFICFDIEYTSPALQLVSRGIRNFAYSTSWVNQPPLLTAQMTQQAWSRKYNANLIAANNGVSSAKSGGGIYSTGSIFSEFFDPASLKVDRTLVASLPKVPPILDEDQAFSGFNVTTTFGDLTAVLHKSEPERLCTIPSSYLGTMACTPFSGQGQHYVQVKSKEGLHCRLNATVRSGNSQYVLAAQVSTKRFPGTPDPLSTEMCAVYRCVVPKGRSQSGLVCLASFESGDTKFSKLELAGNFTPTYQVLATLAVNRAQVLQPSAMNVTSMGLVTSAAALESESLYSAALLALARSYSRASTN